MAEIVDYSIFVGAADWRHAHWQTRFYPEELPEEWWLSFYNSQFRCVYLSWPMWENNTASAAETWLTDTRSNFRFVLQPPEVMNDQAAQFLAAMGGRAILERADSGQAKIVWFPPQPDLRQLRREIQLAVDQGRELYLLSREADLSALEKVNSLVELMGY